MEVDNLQQTWLEVPRAQAKSQNGGSSRVADAEIPTMRLHPVHIASGGKLQPVDHAAAQELCSPEPVQRGRRKVGTELRLGRMPPVAFEDGHLEVLIGTQCIRIPMLLASTWTGHDKSTGEPLLVVTAAGIGTGTPSGGAGHALLAASTPSELGSYKSTEPSGIFCCCSCFERQGGEYWLCAKTQHRYCLKCKPRNQPKTWVMILENLSDSTWALRKLLGLLGAAGAIRDSLTQEFHLDRKLGKGATATVWLGRRKDKNGACSMLSESSSPGDELEDALAEDQEECVQGYFGFWHLPSKRAAIKVTVRDTEEQKRKTGLMREAAMLGAVGNHPHIIRLFGIFRIESSQAEALGLNGDSEGEVDSGDDPVLREMPRWALALEFCECGNLHRAVRVTGRFRESDAGMVMRHIFSALAHVHAAQVLHRDVKTENILLAGDGRPVLADFGVACRLDDASELGKRCGSPGFAAPEILDRKFAPIFSPKADAFGCGVIFYFLLSGELPFIGPDVKSTLKSNLRCKPKMEPAEVFGNLSPGCKELLLQLIGKKPENRLSCAEAARHSWLLEMAEENLSEEEQDEGDIPSRAFGSDPIPKVEAQDPEESSEKADDSRRIHELPSFRSSGGSLASDFNYIPPRAAPLGDEDVLTPTCTKERIDVGGGPGLGQLAHQIRGGQETEPAKLQQLRAAMAEGQDVHHLENDWSGSVLPAPSYNANTGSWIMSTPPSYGSGMDHESPGVSPVVSHRGDSDGENQALADAIRDLEVFDSEKGGAHETEQSAWAAVDTAEKETDSGRRSSGSVVPRKPESPPPRNSGFQRPGRYGRQYDREREESPTLVEATVDAAKEVRSPSRSPHSQLASPAGYMVHRKMQQAAELPEAPPHEPNGQAGGRWADAADPPGFSREDRSSEGSSPLANSPGRPGPFSSQSLSPKDKKDGVSLPPLVPVVRSNTAAEKVSPQRELRLGPRAFTDKHD